MLPWVQRHIKLIVQILAIEAMFAAIILALRTEDIGKDADTIIILAAWAGWLTWRQSKLQTPKKRRLPPT